MSQAIADPKTLMDELGLTDLPQDKQEQLAIKMTEVILKRMFLETVEKLNDQDQESFGKMIDEKASPEEIDKFLREKIGEYDALLEKVVADFKAEMKKNLIV